MNYCSLTMVLINEYVFRNIFVLNKTYMQLSISNLSKSNILQINKRFYGCRLKRHVI